MGRERTRILGRAGLFVAVTAVGAWLAVPLPGGLFFSGQLAAVLASGLILGPGAGACAQAAYLGLGLAGLPVFAAFRAGPAVLFGPTGGYLLGFVPAAAVAGWLARTRWGSFPAAVAGTIVVWACGTGGVLWWTGGSVASALAVGVAPFVVPDLTKAVLAALVAARMRRACGRQSW